MIFSFRLDYNNPTYYKALDFIDRIKNTFYSEDPLSVLFKRDIIELDEGIILFRINFIIPNFSFMLLLPLILGIIFKSPSLYITSGIIFIIINFVFSGIAWIPTFYLSFRKTGYKGTIKLLRKEEIIGALIWHK